MWVVECLLLLLWRVHVHTSILWIAITPTACLPAFAEPLLHNQSTFFSSFQTPILILHYCIISILVWHQQRLARFLAHRTLAVLFTERFAMRLMVLYLAQRLLHLR